jgi:two-component system chemotaxis response regulator CheY
MRVLIVDDSSFIREYMRQLLQRMGIECREAVNGEEALAALRAEEVFDLMLLDLNMPVMNGLECVRTLREKKLSPATKVMMVTTEGDWTFMCRALEYGADEFLMKPVHAGEPSRKDVDAGIFDRGLKTESERNDARWRGFRDECYGFLWRMIRR